jgi:HAD superfamily hydrolase (TIGR01459 family)
VSDIDALSSRYRLILCDIWGVVHDGVTLYPGAAERLQKWRGEGRTVVLITNAPRTADAVEQQLHRIGLPRDAWNAISTSGEAGITALLALGRPVGFIGTDEDRAILQGRGVPFLGLQEAHDIACTGLFAHLPAPEEHHALLGEAAARDAVLHCLNPDRIVVRGGVTEPCAGALADLYEALGGRVEWYGKPHETIYRHALGLGGNPAPDQVLAVGDSLQTDVLGAARMGFDCLFVTGGIHAGEGFPPDFAARNGLGAWQPVAVVDSLR